MSRIIIYILLIISPLVLLSQAKTDAGYIFRGVIIDGDTMPHLTLKPVVILPPIEFKSHKEYLKFRKLVINVKKVYPYSQIAKKAFQEINIAVDTIKSEREKKKFIKQKEEELKDKYADQLKKLSITQGHILIKMIDREIGKTSYELLKELRGSFSAFMWQSVARLFGENLKDDFDEDGEDEFLNRIIIMIENGQL